MITPTSIDGANKALCIAIKHVLAPLLPADQIMTEEEAATYIKNSVWQFMRLRYDWDCWTNVTEETYSLARAANGVLYCVATKIPDNLNWPEVIAEGYDPEAAIAVLEFLVTHIKPKIANVSFLAFVAMYVGIGKRGSITEGMVNKINTAMKNELCMDVTITKELIALVYQSFGEYINESNSKTFFETCATFILTGFSLRTTIMLHQITHSGLTAIVTIKTAYEIFRGFPWCKIAFLLPNEVRNATAALLTINNNPYYGFARNPNRITSIKYKSLAYLAKEILIKYGGRNYDRLKYYVGWTKEPLHKNLLDFVIEAFDPSTMTHNRDVRSGEVAQIIDEFMIAVALNRDLDL